MPSQLSSVLGRRLPSSEEAAIRARAPYLYSSLAAKDQKAYNDKAMALSRAGLAQNAAYNEKSLALQSDAADEAKRQAKKAEMFGYADLGMKGGLGAIQYSDSLKSLLGIGTDAAATTGTGAPTASMLGSTSMSAPVTSAVANSAPTLASSAVGAPSAASFAPATAGNLAAQKTALTGFGVSGVGSGAAAIGAPSAASFAPSIASNLAAQQSALAGLGVTGASSAGTAAGSAAAGAAATGATGAGLSLSGAAGAATAGIAGGSIANMIGGGKSGATKATKGVLGGAAAGAAYGSVVPGLGTVAGAAIGGVVGAVTSVVGGGGRVICTKLVEVGLMDKRLHRAEAAWSMKNKSTATIRGYHLWAVPFVRFMEGKPRFNKAVAWVVTPYAKFLAHRAGSNLGRFNWPGWVIDKVGTSVCWLLGQCTKYDKVHPMWDSRDSDRRAIPFGAGGE